MFCRLRASYGFLFLLTASLLWPTFGTAPAQDGWMLDFDGSTAEARRCYCQRNLRLIDAAKWQWAMDQPTFDLKAEPSWADISGPLTYLEQQPECPDGGTYTIGSLRTEPSCSRSATPDEPHTFQEAPCARNAREEQCICQWQLRRIDIATRWLIDSSFQEFDMVPPNIQILAAESFLRQIPECPGGGSYTLGSYLTKPTCSLHDQERFGHDFTHTPCFDVPPPDGPAPYGVAPVLYYGIRTAEQCQLGLLQIDNAKIQWALETNQPPDAVPTQQELIDMGFLQSIYSCPTGGTYTIGAAGMDPICSHATVGPYPHVVCEAYPQWTESLRVRQQARRQQCQDIQRRIQAAKLQWQLEHNQDETAFPSANDLVGPGRYLRRHPICPELGMYYLGAVNEPVSCSLSEASYRHHTFPTNPPEPMPWP